MAGLKVYRCDAGSDIEARIALIADGLQRQGLGRAKAQPAGISAGFLTCQAGYAANRPPAASRAAPAIKGNFFMSGLQVNEGKHRVGCCGSRGYRAWASC